MAIRIAIACLVLAIAWIYSGRRLTLLLDGITTIRKVGLPYRPATYEGGGLRLAGLGLTFGGIDNLRSDIDVKVDSARRAVLTVGGAAFPFGPTVGGVAPGGRPEFEFQPDPGDTVSFTSSQSLLSWPVPFEFSFLGGRSPWWKRYVYYRLTWKKASGGKLEIIWRYEQQYYTVDRYSANSAWTKPEMMWNSQTGLLRVRIEPGGFVWTSDPRL